VWGLVATDDPTAAPPLIGSAFGLQSGAKVTGDDTGWG
jgi:hypothetical protein